MAKIARSIQRWWRRVLVTNQFVELHRPWHCRRLAWDDVDDFELPASPFPAAPKTLRLYPHRGKPFNISLTSDLRRELADAYPPLAEHGIERPQQRRSRPPSTLRVRWRRDRSDLAAVVFGGIAFTVLIAIAISAAREGLHYVRLRLDHRTAAGEVLAIDFDEDRRDASVDAIVRYTVDDGRAFEVRRRVVKSFRNEGEVGDAVTVEYLPADPKIARIGGWDDDGRTGLSLLVLLPLAGVAGFFAYDGIAKWLAPLRVAFMWKVAPSDGPLCAMVGDVPIRLVRDAFPDRHDGGLVLGLLKYRGVDLRGSTQRLVADLRGVDLAPRVVAEEYVVLDAFDAGRLLGRLGPREIAHGDYAMVPEDDANAVAASLLAVDAGPDQIEALSRARVYLWNRQIGPFAREDMPALLDQWAERQVGELWDGNPPPDVDLPRDIAGLLDINATFGGYEFLAERVGDDVRLWCTRHDQDDATLLERRLGRWVATHGLRPPRPLRSFLKSLRWPRSWT